MTLHEAIKSGPLLCDGGMGTQLVNRGLRSGDVPELWNVNRQDDIADVHRAYKDAGCNLITTNSFGASSVALARHGLESRMRELNLAAASAARQVSEGSGFVLGDIGPSTQMIEPYGDLAEQDAMTSFSQQAEALLAGGVDGFVIETMGDPNEMQLAIRGVREVSGTHPVLATYAFSRDKSGAFRTMMGTTVHDAAKAALEVGADVIGANCGTNLSLDDYADLAREFVSAAGVTPVLIQPNAGSPKLLDGSYRYDAAPAAMAELASRMLASGVRIIGGCCGTTPDHIRAMATVLPRRG